VTIFAFRFLAFYRCAMGDLCRYTCVNSLKQAAAVPIRRGVEMKLPASRPTLRQTLVANQHQATKMANIATTWAGEMHISTM
jgi:hypothetical protein